MGLSAAAARCLQRAHTICMHPGGTEGVWTVLSAFFIPGDRKTGSRESQICDFFYSIINQRGQLPSLFYLILPFILDLSSYCDSSEFSASSSGTSRGRKPHQIGTVLLWIISRYWYRNRFSKLHFHFSHQVTGLICK